MREALRRRLDEVLDRRVGGAAEVFAGARSHRDETAKLARVAGEDLDAAAARRVEALRASPPAPLGTRGLASARGRGRIVALDREAVAARADARAAAAASDAARHRLLRSLVRRRVLRRVLAGDPGDPRRPAGVAGGPDP